MQRGEAAGRVSTDATSRAWPHPFADVRGDASAITTRLLAGIGDGGRGLAKKLIDVRRATATLAAAGVLPLQAFEVEPATARVVLRTAGFVGTTVGELLERETLPTARVLAILSGVARALAAAHREGLVHRALGPASVLVGANDEVRVLDFGVGELLRQDSPSTSVRLEPFTPERVLGLPPSVGEDIYLVGCLAYALVTGAPPFVDGDVEHARRQHAIEDPPRLARKAGLSISPALARAIDRCLAKDAEDRFASMDELVHALAEATAADAKPAIAAKTVAPPPTIAAPRTIIAPPRLAAPPTVATPTKPVPAPTIVAPRMPAPTSAAPPKPVPTIAPRPTTGPQPTLAAKPTTGPHATVAAKPTTGPHATVAARPTTGPQPTLAAKPATGPQPTVAATPAAEPPPIVAATPPAEPPPVVAPVVVVPPAVEAAPPPVAEPPKSREPTVPLVTTSVGASPSRGLAAFLGAAPSSSRKVLAAVAAAIAILCIGLALTGGDDTNEPIAVAATEPAGDPAPSVDAMPRAVLPDETPPTTIVVSTPKPAVDPAAGPTADAQTGPGALEPDDSVDAAATDVEIAADAPSTPAVSELLASAKAARAQGRRADAVTAYKQVAVIDPKNAEALGALARISFDRADFADAVHWGKRAVAASPKSAKARIALGDAYYKLGKRGEAEAQYRKADALGHQLAERRLAMLAGR